jgi:hypothetical protein
MKEAPVETPSGMRGLRNKKEEAMVGKKKGNYQLWTFSEWL